MRERILHYLEQSSSPLPADRILHDVLNIHSPNSQTADKVLSGILGNDPRFRRESAGLWQVSNVPSAKTLNLLYGAVTLFLQCTNASDKRRIIRGAIYIPETGLSSEFSFPGFRTPTQARQLRHSCTQTLDRLLVVWSASDLRLWNWLLRYHGLAGREAEVLYLGKLARRVLSPSLSRFRPEDLSSQLGISPPDTDRARSMARFFAVILEQLLESIPPEYRTGMEGVQRWLDAGKERIDFSRFAFDAEFVRRIPDSPGVYMMRSRNGEILYVGKARNLKRRINSYFTSRALKNPKIGMLHGLLHSLDFVPTASEVEALLLEMRMIRDFRPPMNLQTEVHEQPSSYGKDYNLILLVADRDSKKAEVYFLYQGSFVGQRTVALGGNIPKKLRERMRSLYFSTVGKKKRGKESWEKEIVSRWLGANMRYLNFVDVNEAGTYESVLRRLEQHLRDPQRLSQKVYYR